MLMWAINLLIHSQARITSPETTNAAQSTANGNSNQLTHQSICSTLCSLGGCCSKNQESTETELTDTSPNNSDNPPQSSNTSDSVNSATSGIKCTELLPYPPPSYEESVSFGALSLPVHLSEVPPTYEEMD